MNYLLFSEDYFKTGRDAKGQQIIVGVLAPYIVALQFTEEGELISVTKHRAAVSDDAIPYDVHGEAFSDLLAEVKSQMGFVPGRICIQKFFLEEDYTGIQDLPEHFLDYLNNKDDGEVYDPETKESYEEIIAEWKKKNNFVFWWGNDYYIDGETGEVESS